jgi:hypothetical protein
MLQHRRSIYAAKIDESIRPSSDLKIIPGYYNDLQNLRASPRSSAMLHFAAAKTAAWIFWVTQQKGRPGLRWDAL